VKLAHIDYVNLMRIAFIAATLVLALGRGSAEDGKPLKVMTFNIQHGIDGSHKYNLQRAIDVIAKVQPDIVGLQEVTRNHPYYNCDDQPAKIAAGLKAATGRDWSIAYEQEWFTPNVECRDSGRGDGKETEGLALLSPTPLGPTMMTPLPVSRIALAVRLQSADGLPIVVTHLASGGKNSDARQKEIDALLRWTRALGAAQILMGDFNASPDDPELKPLLDAYTDAGGEPSHGERRIDFIFYRAPALKLTRIQTLDTTPWFGAAASDHKPVVATFAK
jgi:endonuclease/exonuclease/phosphatase family metal-dependent hydrolase